MTVLKWGVETLVNTNVTGNQGLPSVTTLTNGTYVVFWTDFDAAGGDGDGSCVKFQRYDAAGNRIGGEVIANVNTPTFQFFPDVIGTDDGGFAAVWKDLSTSTLEYRRFDANGSAPAPADQPLVPVGAQVSPAITTLGTGFAVA